MTPPSRSPGAPTAMVSGVELTPPQIDRIEQSGGVVLWHGFAGHPHGDTMAISELTGLRSVLADTEVWFGPGLSSTIMNAAPRLRWVQANSAGVEGFLFPELVRSSITLTNVKGMHAATTAEHTFSLLLALARGLRSSVIAQSRGEWTPTPIEEVMPVYGTRLLVLGTGAIGAAIALRAAAFGMTVSGMNRSGASVVGFDTVRPVSQLLDAVADCDWFVLAAPATGETRAMINESVLSAMKPSAILINIARGALVDEGALSEALADGTIRAAGLDVFAHEPLAADSPLWRLPNVLITPHAGGAMLSYGDRAVSYLVENLKLFRKELDLRSVVDKAAGY
jgi:phosphoglycerate dehydrogenase-like enzyme